MTRPSHPSLTGFWQDGQWRELTDPHAPATYRQLRWLNAARCLELTWPGQAEPITVGQAGWAIDNAAAENADADEHRDDPLRPGDDERQGTNVVNTITGSESAALVRSGAVEFAAGFPGVEPCPPNASANLRPDREWRQ